MNSEPAIIQLATRKRSQYYLGSCFIIGFFNLVSYRFSTNNVPSS